MKYADHLRRFGQAWAFLCGLCTAHIIHWRNPDANPWHSVAAAGIVVAVTCIIAMASENQEDRP